MLLGAVGVMASCRGRIDGVEREALDVGIVGVLGVGVGVLERCCPGERPAAVRGGGIRRLLGPTNILCVGLEARRRRRSSAVAQMEEQDLEGGRRGTNDGEVGLDVGKGLSEVC